MFKRSVLGTTSALLLAWACVGCGSDAAAESGGIGGVGGTSGQAGQGATGGSAGNAGQGATGGSAGSGGAAGSAGQGGSAGAWFDIEGWYPSSGLTPHFYPQPDDSFRVHPTHPRLYFRETDVDWIKARGAGPLSDQWANLQWMASSMAQLSPSGAEATASVGGWYGSKAEAIAFLALMEQNDTYLTWAVEWGKALAALPVPTSDEDLRARILRMAVAYDWLYNAMSDADREQLRNGLIALVEVLHDWSYMAEPSYTGGHERRGYAALAAGVLALYGDYPEAEALLAECRQHLLEGFYPTQSWIAQDGGYHMGWAYSSTYLNFDQPYLLWTVGTNDVVMDDWMGAAADWYVYGLRGDDQFPQAGDAYSVGASLGVKAAIYGAGPTSNASARWFLQEKTDGVSEPILQMVMLDANLAPAPPTSLPTGKLFRNAGVVIARDGWDAGSTHFAFKSGSFFSINHHHRDENTFTLYYRAPLAIDSGYYDSYGSAHWSNYFTRTIAHNAMIVLDPSQQMTLYGNAVSNDGGQLFRQDPRTLAEIQPGGQSSLDGILRFENRDAFTYAWGDASKAYDAARVTLAQREVVFLRPTERPHPVIVILDRVDAPSAAFQKKFVLHTIDQPTITGKLAVNARDGGRLTSMTLLPSDAQLALVGGAGSEFFVDGTNYPFDANGGEGDPAAKGIYPGSWRLEVSPGQSHESDLFLHVLFVDDDSAGPVQPTDATLLSDAEAVGVEVAGWTVVFPRTPTGVGSVQYTLVKGGPSHHLVAGLPPGASMTYEVSGATGQVQTGDGGCAVFDVNADAGTIVAVK